MKIKIFEKKPKKGGIPAADKKAIIKIFVNVYWAPMVFKKFIVFTCEVFSWNNTTKIGKREMLYIKIYDQIKLRVCSYSYVNNKVRQFYFLIVFLKILTNETASMSNSLSYIRLLNRSTMNRFLFLIIFTFFL